MDAQSLKSPINVNEDGTVYYREIGNEVAEFEACYRAQLPVLLKGPTGCGKSRFLEYLAYKLERPLISVACNEDTTSTDLIGRFLIKGSDTVWQDGPATKAARNGAILYLDEIAEARDDVLVALHPLTDHRRQLFIDKINETITAPPTFMCVASFNPGYQSSLKELKPSTRQRFVTIAFDYPESSIEAEIIAEVTQLDKKIAKSLAALGQEIRKLTQLGLKETVSTRLLVHVGLLIKQGTKMRRAAEIGIAEVLSDDLKTIQALKDIIHLKL